MLIEPDSEVILHNEKLNITNKFGLITLVRKRAIMLLDGCPALTKTDKRNPVSIALQEIELGLVTIREPGVVEPGDEPMDTLSSEAQALAVSLGL